MRTNLVSAISGSVLALAMAFPAVAAVTTQEIRDGFIGLYRGLGYQVTIGSESISGDTMTLDNLSLVAKLPDNKGKFLATYDWVKLKEVNGTVEISLAPTLTINFQAGSGSKKDIRAVAHATMPDVSIIASGSMDDLSVESRVPGMNLVLDKLMVDGKPVPVTASIDSGANSSSYKIVRLENGRQRFDGSSSLASLSFEANMKEPDGAGFMNMTGDVADISSTFSAEFSKFGISAFTDPLGILRIGLDGRSSLKSGAFNFNVNSDIGGDTTNVTASGNSGQFGFNLSDKVIGYNISESGVKLAFASSKLPVPWVKLGYDKLAFSFSLPMAKSAEPSDFSVKAALRGLRVDESLWSMIDPGKILPRDPVTLALDISGKLMVLANLSNPKSDRALKGLPYLPVSVDLNDLTVSALGAILTGKGGVTFNSASGKTVDGVPVPVGSLKLDLKGGYGLMDKLVTLGLLPKNTATGIRAMLGTFSVPVGDDEIQTKIEATADGAISANGQRIR